MRHLVLDGEDVLQLAIVALGPEMRVMGRVDQLRGDAHPVAGAPHAAFDEVADAEPAGDVLCLDRLSLERERRVARDDEQRAKARKLSDDVLGYPVAEILLLGITGHVGERQNGDGGLLGER